MTIEGYAPYIEESSQRPTYNHGNKLPYYSSGWYWWPYYNKNYYKEYWN